MASNSESDVVSMVRTVYRSNVASDLCTCLRRVADRAFMLRPADPRSIAIVNTVLAFRWHNSDMPNNLFVQFCSGLVGSSFEWTDVVMTALCQKLRPLTPAEEETDPVYSTMNGQAPNPLEPFADAAAGTMATCNAIRKLVTLTPSAVSSLEAALKQAKPQVGLAECGPLFITGLLTLADTIPAVLPECIQIAVSITVQLDTGSGIPGFMAIRDESTHPDDRSETDSVGDLAASLCEVGSLAISLGPGSALMPSLSPVDPTESSHQKPSNAQAVSARSADDCASRITKWLIELQSDSGPDQATRVKKVFIALEQAFSSSVLCHRTFVSHWPLFVLSALDVNCGNTLMLDLYRTCVTTETNTATRAECASFLGSFMVRSASVGPQELASFIEVATAYLATAIITAAKDPNFSFDSETPAIVVEKRLLGLAPIIALLDALLLVLTMRQCVLFPISPATGLPEPLPVIIRANVPTTIALSGPLILTCHPLVLRHFTDLAVHSGLIPDLGEAIDKVREQFPRIHPASLPAPYTWLAPSVGPLTRTLVSPLLQDVPFDIAD